MSDTTEAAPRMRGHARSMMTPRVPALAPETPLSEAAVLLRSGHYRGLPVVEAGLVVGVVSETDLLRALLEKGELHGPVRPLMTAPAITVDEFDTADDVLTLFRTRHVHLLPVVRSGKLVGMVTSSDVVRYFVDHELDAPADLA